MEKNTLWLTKRLKELGKTKLDMAYFLQIPYPRLSDLEKGKWNFQLKHIKKASEYFGFDQSAFIDFLNGEITEEELYNRKSIAITDADLKLLQAIKSVAASTQNENKAENTPQQKQLPEKER